MPVVRYVALAALVVWLGSAVLSVGADWFRSLERVAFVCGAVMLVGLFTMKFVGPPPHDFTVRAVLVTLMLGVNTVAVFWGRSNASTAIVLALGFVLLLWYARE